jgi:hypothetical protein
LLSYEIRKYLFNFHFIYLFIFYFNSGTTLH